MSNGESGTISYRDSIVWLDDAPLFTDEQKIARLYEAVMRPSYEVEARKISISKEKAHQIQAKLGISGEVDPGQIANLLESFLSARLKASGEAKYDGNWSESQDCTIKLRPISTPSHRLKQLTTHYLAEQSERIFLTPSFANTDWRSPSEILKVPRSLVFLDFPSLKEVENSDHLQKTKLIPTAAEFEDGSIAPLFNKLEGERGQRPQEYPREPDCDDTEELREARKEYWKWFEDNFKPKKAMMVVEEAVSEHGRLRWIDYRVPLTEEGDTLHLHVCPSGEYDTGVFAYNFIKRGFKHGLRLVGTLKSEPDMNVLAIYEK